MTDEERQRYEYECAHRAQASEHQVATDDARALRGLLNAVRDALGPTCADATHEALPGLVAEVVACDAEMHREVDARGERLREMAAEVAHLEARRGALLAEVDRLAARDRDAGVVIEDLRKMIAGASVDLAAARDDAAQARLDGAREMRERAAGVCDAERAGHEATGDALRDPTYWGCLANEHRTAAEAIRALPLPGEEVAAPRVCGFCKGRGMVAYGREVEDACEACCGAGGAQ